MASPADIVRSILLDLELVRLPGPPTQQTGDGTVVCYTSSMPDEDDTALLIRDVQGIMFYKSQRGKAASHPGIKILMRALDETGYDVLNNIVATLDPLNLISTTWLSVTHYVQSIYRQNDIVELGEEIGKKRMLWTVNARVAFQAREPSLG